MDVFDDDESIVVKAELPGVDKDQITVDVQGRILTLKGERSSDQEAKEETIIAGNAPMVVSNGLSHCRPK